MTEATKTVPPQAIYVLGIRTEDIDKYLDDYLTLYPAVTGAVARNKNLTAKQMDRLIEHGSGKTLTFIIKRHNWWGDSTQAQRKTMLDKAVALHKSEDADDVASSKKILSLFAERKELTTEEFHLIYETVKSSENRPLMLLAANPHTPSEIVDKLIENCAPNVLIFAIKNRTLTPAQLRALVDKFILGKKQHHNRANRVFNHVNFTNDMVIEFINEPWDENHTLKLVELLRHRANIQENLLDVVYEKMKATNVIESKRFLSVFSNQRYTPEKVYRENWDNEENKSWLKSSLVKNWHVPAEYVLQVEQQEDVYSTRDVEIGKALPNWGARLKTYVGNVMPEIDVENLPVAWVEELAKTCQP